MVIPWSLKPLYGILSDNVRLFGEYRLSYIRTMTFLAIVFQILSFLLCTSNKYVVLVILTSNQVANAFLDVVTDALLIAVSRKNPERGAEDLQSMRYATIAFGGLIGAAVGSWYTERFHPRYAFLFLPLPLTVIFGLTFYVDEEQHAGADESANVPQDRLKAAFGFLRTPLALRTSIYTFVVGTLSISFGDIMYFYLLDKLGFTKQFYGIIIIAVFASSILGSALYNCFLRNAEYRNIFTVSQIIIVCYDALQVLFVMRVTKTVLGLDDRLVALFSTASEEVLDQALRFMPAVVLISKITPPRVEGTVYSIFASINNFTFGFLAPSIGAALASYYGVSRTNFT